MFGIVGDVVTVVSVAELASSLCRTLTDIRTQAGRNESKWEILENTSTWVAVEIGRLREEGRIVRNDPFVRSIDGQLRTIISLVEGLHQTFSRSYRVTKAMSARAISVTLDEAAERLKRLQVEIGAKVSFSTFRHVAVPSKATPMLPRRFTVDERANKILDFLKQDEPGIEVRVVAICGNGGLGKTTLMNWTQTKLKEQNDQLDTPYVKVEYKPTTEKLKELQTSLIQQLGGPKWDLQSVDHGKQETAKIISLAGSFCLAIDDVWDVADLEKLIPHGLGALLPLSSSILLTTRNKKVAEKLEQLCELETGARCKVLRYHPDILHVEDARKFFMEYARPLKEDQHKELVDGVLSVCGGLPLALELLGTYFSCQSNRSQWPELIHRMRSLERLGMEAEDGELRINEVLAYSYERLHEDAQNAFLDVAMYFCGWDWETVECILGVNEIDALENHCLLKKELGSRKVADLCSSSGCMNHTIALRGSTLQTTVVGVHDLVLLFGQRKAKENYRFKDEDHVQDCELSKVKGLWNFKVIVDQPELETSSLKGMQSLRVLRGSIDDGDGCPELRDLRYLDLDGAGNCTWQPRFGRRCGQLGFMNLANLKSDFKQSQFPPRLRHLYVHDCENMVKLPLSCDDVTALRVLCIHGCPRLQRVPKSFGEFTNLLTLDLQFASALYNSNLLNQLPSGLQTLRIMNMEDVEESPWHLGDLQFAREISLDDWPDLKTLAGSGIGECTSLELLQLSRCYSLSCLPEVCALKSLRELRLIFCDGLEELPEGLGELTSLCVLWLSECSLRKLPESVGRLKILSVLVVTNCRMIEMLPESLGELKKLLYLDLSGCEGLEKLPTTFGQLVSLRSLNLRGCKRLRDLSSESFFGTLRVLKELLLDGRQPCFEDEWSLGSNSCASGRRYEREGTPSGCTGLTLSSGFFSRLDKLKELREYVVDCDTQCGEAMLAELGSSRKWMSLESLHLRDCHGHSLKELPATLPTNLKALRQLQVNLFTSLEELPQSIGNLRAISRIQMKDCGKLKALPTTIGDCSRLRSLLLDGCTSLQGLPHSIGNCTQLQTLSLKRCSSFKGLPHTIGNCKQLERLELHCLEKLEALSESIIGLENLVHFDLQGCDDVNELPEDLSSWKQLETLTVKKCCRLAKLPRSIGDLKALTYFAISECPTFNELPESIGDCTRLQVLLVEKCCALEKLPESIGKLRALTELRVTDCANLKELPMSVVNLKALKKPVALIRCPNVRNLQGLTPNLVISCDTWGGYNEILDEPTDCDTAIKLSGIKKNPKPTEWRQNKRQKQILGDLPVHLQERHVSKTEVQEVGKRVGQSLECLQPFFQVQGLEIRLREGVL